MKYDKQFFLDFVENMPEEHKKCGVNTAEDGSGTVDLGDFIVHYGQALALFWFQDSKRAPKKKPKHEDDCGK